MQISTLDLNAYGTVIQCRQLIDTFFSFISESPLVFPCLECLQLGHCEDEKENKVALYLEERLKQVRELAGLMRLRSLYLNTINILTKKLR